VAGVFDHFLGLLLTLPGIEVLDSNGPPLNGADVEDLRGHGKSFQPPKVDESLSLV
jgi:hypothetical protein